MSIGLHDVVPISERRFLAAESPIWDDRAKRAYFVDIKGHALFAFDPVTGRIAEWPVPEDIGFVALTDGPELVLGLKSGLVLFDPATGRSVPFGAVPVADDERLNDGKVDARGDLYFGSMGMDGQPGRGALFRLSSSSGLARIDWEYDIPNGPAFGSDGAVYHCDTPRGIIYRLTSHQGRWSRDTALQLEAETGRPDGIAVDPSGRVWAGLWGGGGLLVFDPATGGQQHLPLPATYVTALCPIGQNSNQILITSANTPILCGEPAQRPDDGRVFLARTNVTWPAASFRYRLYGEAAPS